MQEFSPLRKTSGNLSFLMFSFAPKSRVFQQNRHSPNAGLLFKSRAGIIRDFDLMKEAIKHYEH